MEKKEGSPKKSQPMENGNGNAGYRNGRRPQPDLHRSVNTVLMGVIAFLLIWGFNKAATHFEDYARTKSDVRIITLDVARNQAEMQRLKENIVEQHQAIWRAINALERE